MISDNDADLVGMIGQIYDAVIDKTLWWNALDRIRAYFGFHLGVIAVTGFPSGKSIVQVAVNVPEDFAARMTSYTNEILNLWGGPARLAMLPLEEPLLNSQVTPRSVWSTNPYYLEWARPLGLVDQIGILLARDSTMMGSVGLGRHESAPPLTGDDMEGLRLLAPHLRRAVTISGLLDVAADTTKTFQAALDATTAGVVLVGADLRLLHANDAAGAMLRASDPILSLGGKLALRHELVPGQLEAAVRSASEDEAQLGRRGSGISARLRNGEPVSINVMPLNRRPLRGGTGSAATAAVFIANATAPIEMPAEAMRLLYELTPAEERVFELIVAGHTTKEIAETLGVLPGTVRTQLLRVFEKTGRHTRADLVRLSREITLPA